MIKVMEIRVTYIKNDWVGYEAIDSEKYLDGSISLDNFPDIPKTDGTGIYYLILQGSIVKGIAKKLK